MKKMRPNSLAGVDIDLLNWFKSKEGIANVVLQGLDFVHKAKEIAELLDVDPEKIDLNWVNRRKKRHSIPSQMKLSNILL